MSKSYSSCCPRDGFDLDATNLGSLYFGLPAAGHSMKEVVPSGKLTLIGAQIEVAGPSVAGMDARLEEVAEMFKLLELKLVRAQHHSHLFRDTGYFSRVHH